MANRIDSPEYWIEDFQPTADELDALKSAMLDTMAPAPIENLAGQLIRGRVEQALSARKKAADGKGVPYLPSDSYEKGQTLIFPALEGAKGKITAVRKGNNPMYGKYQVIQVDLEGQEREFASGIGWEHELSAAQADLDADLLVDHYASVIAPQLRERLGSEGDWQNTGNLWVLSALVPDVNAGHRNLAEAILMLANEPLPAEKLLEEIDLDPSAPAETRRLALELALNEDERFRNVGAIESPLWTLTSQT
jgi:hypothetical protein